jgi:outer membrane lipoprotein-sorting protein
MRRVSTVALLVALLPAAFAGTQARPPAAAQILRKAEEMRNPDLDYAVDFAIHGVSRGATAGERDASYSMIARGKDRTVILMRSPEPLYGAVVLMADGRYWMLLPKASRPWELSAAQMMNGDVATGDLARANLEKGYAATLDGEEAIDGEACWRLELKAESAAAHYARIVYWVAKKGSFPRKLEHYGPTGALLETVRYGGYQKGALGLRSMRLEIESAGEWKESSTLTFTNLRKIDPAPVSFAPDGMIAFRDAAIAARDAAAASDVPLERMLRAMAPPAAPERKR